MIENVIATPEPTPLPKITIEELSNVEGQPLVVHIPENYQFPEAKPSQPKESSDSKDGPTTFELPPATFIARTDPLTDETIEQLLKLPNVELMQAPVRVQNIDGKWMFPKELPRQIKDIFAKALQNQASIDRNLSKRDSAQILIRCPSRLAYERREAIITDFIHVDGGYLYVWSDKLPTLQYSGSIVVPKQTAGDIIAQRSVKQRMTLAVRLHVNDTLAGTLEEGQEQTVFPSQFLPHTLVLLSAPDSETFHASDTFPRSHDEKLADLRAGKEVHWKENERRVFIAIQF